MRDIRDPEMGFADMDIAGVGVAVGTDVEGDAVATLEAVVAGEGVATVGLGVCICWYFCCWLFLWHGWKGLEDGEYGMGGFFSLVVLKELR